MNRTKFTLNIPTNNAEQMFFYNLKNGSTILHTGKCFALPKQKEITIDVTDILNLYQYKGKGILQPIWNGVMYSQPSEQITNLEVGEELHLTTITIELYNSNNVLITSKSKSVLFHTETFETVIPETKIGNTIYYTDFSLIPRMPKTKALRFGKLIYNKSYSSVIWVNKNNITVQNFGSLGGAKVLNIPIPETDLYHNKQLILKVDECSKPYYLCWLTSSGDFQCQPFTAVYTENSTNNMKLSTDEQQTIANKSIKGNWNLSSELLSDYIYKQYMDIFRSPYLLLYITEIDRTVFVNVSGDSIEQKNYQKNGNKPIKFECTVESMEQLLSLF